jgi:hypothetical protein
MSTIDTTRERWSRVVVVLSIGVACACSGDGVNVEAASTAGAASDAGAASRAAAHQPAPEADSPWCAVKQTLEANCTTCHNEAMVAGAPMSLRNYDDLIAPAKSDPSKKVYELVGERVHDTRRPMPPQGELAKAELSEIDAWVTAGAPAGGDPACGHGAAEPSPVLGDDAWPEHCDATFKLLAHGAGGKDDPYVVPPGTEEHPKFDFDVPRGDQALQVIAFRAITDNPKVLHHWILYGPQGELLYPWAPRKYQVYALKGDVGLNLPGGTLTLDMHYNNVLGAMSELDNSGVEICVLEPAHFRKTTAAVYQGFAQLLFSIPPHTKDFDVLGECTLAGELPVTLLTSSPHAHVLARHMQTSVRKKSGDIIMMHDRSFNFGEQYNYDLDPPITLSAGDTVVTKCTYDNDTARAVSWGQGSSDEMCFNFAMYYPMGGIRCAPGTGTGLF